MVSSGGAASLEKMQDQGERAGVVVYVVDAGGGHRAAARALVAATEGRALRLDLQVVSLQEVLAPLDPVKRLLGIPIQNLYNAMLRTRRTAWLRPLLRVLHGSIRLRRRALMARIAGDLRSRRPRVVVSLVPNFNGVIRDAVAAAFPRVPFVVVLTDLADLPPHFWIEPGITRVVVATERAAQQAAALGLPRESVACASGMVLHPRFYPRRRLDERPRLRRELGLRPGGSVVMVMYGGKGSDEMRDLSAALLAEDPSWQVVSICGDNPRLYADLRSVEEDGHGRFIRVGFTDRVVDYLAAADVLVTKPGPGALAEAFHMRVPVVVTRNASTIPQERYNTEFVEELGLGTVVVSTDGMAAAASRLVGDTETRERVVEALQRLPENRAVFEVLDLIESLAATAIPTPGRAARLTTPRSRVNRAPIAATPP
jgi:UDP-N-acetylglucosamine:LPS N-acetylglucosamine transferase